MNSKTIAVAAVAVWLAACIPAQGRADKSAAAESAKRRIDPFTQGEAKAMKALGVVGYGPFAWADDRRTEDLEKVLGEGRLRWLETPHFLIGCSLPATGVPEQPEARKLLNAELQRLNKRCAKMPDRASKLEPWLRVHLYALRAEELYAEIAVLVGHDAASGTHLGQQAKFPLLLFEKKSDAARYLEHFCGRKTVGAMAPVHYAKTGQQGLVLCAEADEPRDEAAVHVQFRYLLVGALLDAAGSFPHWLQTGIAHHFERQVPSTMMLAAPRDDEHVDQATQNKWLEKLQGRARHDGLLAPFRDLVGNYDLGYYGHLQAWSIVQFLWQDTAKFRALLQELKEGGSTEPQLAAIERVYGLDAAALDVAWRDWLRRQR